MHGDETDFPFDDWARLANEGPDSLESARRLMRDSLIEATPAATQARLRGWQWQIDQVRATTPTPLSACVKLSNLMWRKLLGPDGLVEQLERLASDENAPDQRPASARVIPLRRPP